MKATTRADVARGEFRALSRVTLNEYALGWINTYGGRTRRGIGDNTRADYRGALDREILPALGRRRLTEIEPSDIRELARSLARRGLAPSSVTKTIAPLKALLATAVEDRLLRANPAAGVRLAQPKPDTPDEGAERVKAPSV